MAQTKRNKPSSRHGWRRLSESRPAPTPPVQLRAAAHAVKVTGGPLDEEGYKWPIKIIAVGESANSGPSGKQLYYTEEALSAAAADGVFEMVKSYADHPTKTDERERPGRSVRDWIAAVTETKYDPVSKSIVGVWNVVDDAMRAKVRAAHKLGVLDSVGFSIYAAGETSPGERDGKQYELVTSIAKVDGASVDFVTAPAAGGGFDLTRLAASRRSGGIEMKFKTLSELRSAGRVNALLAEAVLKASTDTEARELLTEVDASDELIADAMETRLKAASAPCATCGKDVPAGSAFCPHCGAAQTSGESAAPAPVAEAKPDTKASDPVLKEARTALAEAQRLNAETVKDRRAATIARLVESFDPKSREYLTHQLEAAKDESAMRKLVESHKLYIASLTESHEEMAFPAGTVRGGNVSAGSDPREKYLAAFDGYFSGQDEKDASGSPVPRFRSLREACAKQPKFGGRYVDIGPLDLFRECQGWYHGGFRNGALASYGLRESRPVKLAEAGGTWLRESATTSGFGEVWADRAYKRMMSVYHSSNDVKELLEYASDKEELPDFKSARIIRLGEYANPASVAEGGTYGTLTTPADNEELTSLTKYGFIEDITMEALLGEDGKKMRSLPDRMIGAVLRLERETIINRITTTNPTLNSDGVALYHAGTHTNLLTTALSVNQLAVIERDMMQQTALTSSKQLGSVNRPWAIIIPPELLQLTERIINPSDAYYAAVSNAGTDTTLDPHLFKGRLKILVADHFTNAGDFYVMANPAKMPTFQISRLVGVTQPEFFTQESEDSPSMFDSDKIKWKVRTFLGVEPLDYRSFHFSDV